MKGRATMPMTPDEASQLTEEEAEMLSQLEEGLNEILQGVYNPLDPSWSVRLPLDLLMGLEMPDMPDEPETLGVSVEESELIKKALLNRLDYLKSLLVAKFDEQGWVLLINDGQKFFEITRKVQA
jgi:hypothetical protein